MLQYGYSISIRAEGCAMVDRFQVFYARFISWQALRRDPEISGVARGFLFVLGAVLASAPAHAIVFSDFQSARTVGAGDFELTANVGTTVFGSTDDWASARHEFGGQVAYGVLNRLDLRGRYGYIAAQDFGLSANVLRAGPEVGLLADRLSLYVPFGLAFGSDVDVKERFEFVPTVLSTFHLAGGVDLIPSAKARLPVASNRNVRLAVNLGWGLSKDLTKWALRPETGIEFNPGEGGVLWHFGVGFTFVP